MDKASRPLLLLLMAQWMGMLAAFLTLAVLTDTSVEGSTTDSNIDLPSAASFLSKVGQPHFGLSFDVHLVRIHQALYQCASLVDRTLAARQALIDLRFQGNSSTEDFKLIVQCSWEMENLANSGLLPNAKPIPDAYKVQLVYKTLANKDAYWNLMARYSFNNLTRNTLAYERNCAMVQYSLERAVSVDLKTIFPDRPHSIGGCLVTIRQLFDAAFNSGLRVGMRQALEAQEETHAAAITAYKQMQTELEDKKYDLAIVLDVVARGMPLNLMASRGAVDGSVAMRYTRLAMESRDIMQQYMNAGLNLNPPMSDGQHIFSYAITASIGLSAIGTASVGADPLDNAPILWLIQQGADVEQVSQGRNTFLHDLVSMPIRIQQYGPVIERLIVFGADLLRPDAAWVPALGRLALTLSDVQFRTIVELGRPNWQRSVGLRPRPLIFQLLEGQIPLRPLAHLLAKGLPWRGVVDDMEQPLLSYRMHPATKTFLSTLDRAKTLL